MQFVRVFLIASVLALLAPGCAFHSVSLQRGSRAATVRPPSAATTSSRVAIPRFVYTGVQTFGHQTEVSGDTLTHRWKEAPGERDASLALLEALTDAGFQNVSYQPGVKADYYVVGNFTHKEHVGLWLIWDITLGLPACFAPWPWGMPRRGSMNLGVYDAGGRLIASRKYFLDSNLIGVSAWGAILFGDHDGNLAEFAVGEIVDIIDNARPASAP